MARVPGPDFLIVGAPKAGTTALHAALAQHPDVFVTDPKEPKYWLCDGAPPPHWNGPGDRHSQQEWIWRDDEYAALFSGARPDQVRGESTPFYLWSRGAHRRIGGQDRGGQGGDAAAREAGVKGLRVFPDQADIVHGRAMALAFARRKSDPGMKKGPPRKAALQYGGPG